ncbi:ATP-binding protein [Alteriqipengyuania flavescens]|uniref:AAA family ATPase n=1 Tax=Alteriqipengyuania flavescens TaxID=3053610 RepID=UPI0025B61759|nr:ATP-binding protein [Alteriqipengyuania flavescens]WJY18692.1 ATP-binding protein [Alteriqipengyuania flavescens]WJY24632.1 ATP-binding protein [Alteriqipengyuania flavescens]
MKHQHPIPASKAEPPPPRGAGQAHLTNMTLARQAMVDCTSVGENMPRLGLFYGPSGYGKSVGAAFVAARFDAGYVEAKSIWTQRSLLSELARSIGITRIERTGPRILDQLIEQLRAHPRPLIIDEMDYLVKKQMVDIIRDIHDATSVAILMIGEEALPAKLREWERFDNRILVRAPAQPASEDDALKLRDAYRGEVAIADDLAIEFCRACGGVTRRIVINLEIAQNLALDAGEAAIDRAWWGNRRVETGALPVRRVAERGA